MVIEKPSAKLKKYDVALFKGTSGEYVLHRVLKVRKKDYLICRDNGVYREPVVREQIIDVMTRAFIRMKGSGTFLVKRLNTGDMCKPLLLDMGSAA